MCQILKGFSALRHNHKQLQQLVVMQLLRRFIQLLKNRFCILIKQSFPNHLGVRLRAALIYYAEESAHLWHQQKTITTELMV